jgi:hypothetical protein
LKRVVEKLKEMIVGRQKKGDFSSTGQQEKEKTLEEQEVVVHLIIRPVHSELKRAGTDGDCPLFKDSIMTVSERGEKTKQKSNLRTAVHKIHITPLYPSRNTV